LTSRSRPPGPSCIEPRGAGPSLSKAHRGSAGRGANPFVIKPLAVVMQADAGEPRESEGVLNPAAIRDARGDLYLFPRLVAKGNCSRIGIARVRFDEAGEPVDVVRLGVALEPTAAYEKNAFSGGGCEDPRITYLEALGCYLMAYTAFSPVGPRLALATSRDLFQWDRLGLVNFSPGKRFDLNHVDNKDGVVFPSLVADPRTGEPSVALMHRPSFKESPLYFLAHQLRGRLNAAGDGTVMQAAQFAQQRMAHPSIWMSYCRPEALLGGHVRFHSHHHVLSGRYWWERAKVGAGAPPILTPFGWLLIYHGVAGHDIAGGHLRYSGGAAVLDAQCPGRVLYRSAQPVLVPMAHELDTEGRRHVVFPSGLDRRTDVHQPDRIDVYYGMSDKRIGVGSLTLPHAIPIQEPDAGDGVVQLARAEGW
jgi:beta-1,2-mannobiose phosphorylase / 1,2-beta-oligomannan phosphorylase